MLLPLLVLGVVWDAASPGACRTLQSKVCPQRPPSGMTARSHKIESVISGVQDEATLLTELASYLAIESDKISVVLDPITSTATVSVSFDSVEEGTTIATSLNSEDIASSVEGTTFDEPEFKALATGQALQDVHLRYPGGGSADFRGVPGVAYALFSSPEVAVNMAVDESTFRLKNATIDGTFITDIFVRTREVVATISADASAKIQCKSGAVVVPQYANLTCGETVIGRRMVSYVFDTPHWSLRVSPMPVYDHISGSKRRIDVTAAKRREGQQAHGLLGQGFNGVALDGRKDVYPASGRFKTSAWAEGAIEGRALDYVVRSPLHANFRYSLFS